MDQLGDDLDNWIPIKRCNEHLEEIWSEQSYWDKTFRHRQKHLKLQYDAGRVAIQPNSTTLNSSLDIKQAPLRDNNCDINLEIIVGTKGNEIASKQEELDLYANVIPIYDEYPESDCEEIVEALEEVVETSCVKVVDDLESMVETPTVESIGDLEEIVEASCEEMIDEYKKDGELPCEEIVETLEKVVEMPCIENLEDLKEVVETICMKNVGSTIECLELVDYHPRLEVGIQVEQTKKHEFIKVDFVLEKSPLMDYVHVERFVEFNPTKIRGRIFSKKGRMMRIQSTKSKIIKLRFLQHKLRSMLYLATQMSSKWLLISWDSLQSNPLLLALNGKLNKAEFK